jgi:hypothetical protein
MKFRDEIWDLINIESTNLYLNQNSYLPLSFFVVAKLSSIIPNRCENNNCF